MTALIGSSVAVVVHPETNDMLEGRDFLVAIATVYIAAYIGRGLR